MPGYGFSDHATQRGLDVLSIGDMWATLMSENLSYPRFGAQGGDWGASVTAKLGFSHGDKVIGIHSTSVTRPTPYMGPGSRELSEAEKGLLQRREDWTAAKGGYSHIQGTKPQTLSYGLNDSPAGLAAWIVEKYPSSTTKARGNPGAWKRTRRSRWPAASPFFPPRSAFLLGSGLSVPTMCSNGR